MNDTPLDTMSPGQTGRVKTVTGPNATKKRLMDMGLVRGAPLTILRTAPLGDPVEFEIKGYKLGLRKNDARHVIVEAVDR